MTTIRDKLHQDSDLPAHAALIRKLLLLLRAQDGSTTRLCEALAGDKITLKVLRQRTVAAVPPQVRSALPGAHFVERVTSLVSQGQVLTDNLVYVAMDALPPDIQADLQSQSAPIGHLLPRLWTRRSFLTPAPQVLSILWDAVGLADPDASRAYTIATPQAPCMLVYEVFRRGLVA